MSGPSPAPSGAAGDKKPMSPYLIPVIGVGLVVAAVAAVVAFGGSSTTMTDGTDVREPDANLKDLSEGVKFRDLKAGVGDECQEGARVKVHYTGWLPDGTVFDSSRERGKPADFDLVDGPGGVITGWVEGMSGMKKGGVRKLVISPEKGYRGEKKGSIPPNSTLIFEVELISFSGGGAEPKVKARPRRSPIPADLSKLSDGTLPTADDADLKAIGTAGLKYRDLKVGDGPEVKPGAAAVMDYIGWRRSDGVVFDSSFKRSEAFPANLGGGLIEGWMQGVPGMKVGGIRKLVIPPELGYGARGAGSDIPPGATLVFEIEVLGTR
jgi:peptidylprolyl isomerase